MKVSWIIENFVKEESFKELEAAVEAAGYPLHVIRGDYARADLSVYKNQCTLFNGSIEMCKMVHADLLAAGCGPNIYCNWKNYLCSSYYPIFADHVFNDNYVLIPFIELKRRLYTFYGMFGRSGMLFVRPDSGDKTFKAELLDIQDFPRFYEDLEQYHNDLILVSTPKNIIGEWRFVCTRYKEILAVSSYRYQGVLTRIPSAPIGATEKCKEILEVGYYPDSVFCIDIAQDAAGDFWMMELTSFSSAGLYATKKAPIVQRVSEIAWEDYEKNYINEKFDLQVTRNLL